MWGWPKNAHPRRALVATATVCALGLSSLGAPVAAAPPDGRGRGDVQVAAASKASNGRSDVVQLSRKVRELIRVVEGSDITCDIRNTLVRRLRRLDDALRSGQRTGAGVLLAGWRARAQRMATTGVLSASANNAVQERLGAIQDEIGLDWPARPKPTRNWPKLPECSDTSATMVGATASTWDSNDTLIAITTALYTTGTRVGSLVAGILTLFWPSSTDQPDVTTIVDEAILTDAISDAGTTVQGFTDLIQKWQSTDLKAWLTECGYDPDTSPPDWEPTPGCGTVTARDNVRDGWKNLTDDFVLFMPHFQQNYGGVDYRSDLLPLYVQMENLYLAHLQMGILNRDAWWPGSAATQQIPIDLMHAHIETEPGEPPPDDPGGPNDPDRQDLTGVGYVEDVYELGTEIERPVDTNSSGRLNMDDWEEQNAWARDSGTIQGLFFSDLWPFMNPIAYPDGVPDYKQTRIIYSDPVGCENPAWHYYPDLDPGTGVDPIGPDRNVSSPMALLEGWQDNSIDYLNKAPVVDALQVTGEDGTKTPIMGDPTPEGPSVPWQTGLSLDDPWAMPIINVNVAEGVHTYAGGGAEYWPQGFRFLFPDGGIGAIGSFNTTNFKDHPYTYSKINWYDFAYDGQVLVTARVFDQREWTDIWGNVQDTSADCAVFGFRFSDSF